MANEELYRHKSETYKARLVVADSTTKKLKTELAAAKAKTNTLSKALENAWSLLGDKTRAQAVLDAKLSKAEKQVLDERERCAELQRMLDESEAGRTSALLESELVRKQQYQVRLFKTALKAAFKLPDVGLAAQTNLEVLLEATNTQLQKSDAEKLADKEKLKKLASEPGKDCKATGLAESVLPKTGPRAAGDIDESLSASRGAVGISSDGDTLAAHETSTKKARYEDSLNEKLLRDSGKEVPGGGTFGEKPEAPSTPGKRRIAEPESDAQPAAKFMRLTPRKSPRKIVRDD